MQADCMIYSETKRLIIRSWHQNDLKPFATINRDERVMRHFPSVMSETESEALYRRINEEFAKNGWGLFAIELKSTGEFIGFVGLHEIGFEADFTPGIEIGWRLAAEHHNQGYASEAAAEVVKIAARAGIERLYAFTAKCNRPSERVIIKIGMTKAGEFEHPNLSADSPLRTHVLYKIETRHE